MCSVSHKGKFMEGPCVGNNCIELYVRNNQKKRVGCLHYYSSKRNSVDQFLRNVSVRCRDDIETAYGDLYGDPYLLNMKTIKTLITVDDTTKSVFSYFSGFVWKIILSDGDIEKEEAEEYPPLMRSDKIMNIGIDFDRIVVVDLYNHDAKTHTIIQYLIGFEKDIVEEAKRIVDNVTRDILEIDSSINIEKYGMTYVNVNAFTDEIYQSILFECGVKIYDGSFSSMFGYDTKIYHVIV